MDATPAAAMTDSERFTETRIRNPRALWLARGVWVGLILAVLGIFALGLYEFFQYSAPSCMCDSLMIGDDGVNVQVYPVPGGPAEGLIFDEDIVVAIDGVRLPQPATRFDALRLTDHQEPGSRIVLTVRTGDAPEREVVLYRYYNPRYLPYHAYWVLDLVIMGVFTAVALLIAFNRSDDWMALYTALVLVGFGLVTGTAYSYLDEYHGAVFPFINSALWIIMLTYLFIFPDGRPLRRWSILIAVGYGVWVFIIRVFFPDIPFLLPSLIDLATAAAVVFFMRENYVRRFTPLRKQQTKWVILGVAVAALVRTLSLPFIPILDSLGYVALGDALAIPLEVTNRLLVLVVPLTLAFAAFRYRLYDIDLVINRTLVYGGLTLMLGGVMAAAFFGLKALWEAILGSGQEVLAAVLPAVFITLIFNPTRKRMQSFVDRRIFRLNFDLNQLAAAQKSPEIKNPGALTGKTIGGYQVLGVLGKGGMGEVYQGQANGEIVALKILPEDLAQQSEFVSRFEREANTMRELNHPNIVKLLSAGEQDGVHYLALEYIEGTDLSSHIKQQTKLTYEEATALLRDLAAALDYAHTQGLVHRDIKSSNVMVRGDDPPQAVLMDFGIAKIRDAVTRYTGSGAIGTIDYMAPEQIMAAKEVDLRADVYALGVLAFEMLTGEKPFKGSAAQVMFAHLQQPPPDARDIVKDVPKSAAHAIEKALAKDPTARYSSAGDFAAAL